MNQTDRLDEIKKYKKIFLYGAGEIANTLYPLLKKRGIMIHAFIVSSHENNPINIDHIPVKLLSELDHNEKDTLIIMAVGRKYNDEVETLLKNSGYSYIGNDDDLFLDLQKEWYLSRLVLFGHYKKSIHDKKIIFYVTEKEPKFIFHIILKSLPENILYQYMQKGTLLTQFEQYYGKYHTVPDASKPSERNTVAVYMVKCHKDVGVSRFENISQHVFPIQAGAALTEKLICDIKDNIGENISHKNKNYCECTALYWIWKNAAKNHDYIGLCHYRRCLSLTDEQLVNLNANGIDMVLAAPTLHLPSNIECFNLFITQTDWNNMLDAVKLVRPEYYQAALNYNNQNMACMCNLFIMRNVIFHEYCGFLFDVLEYIENYLNEGNKERQDRYLGYIAENLTSIFAMHNKDRYKIAYSYMLNDI